jgi:hypothetical protein
MTKAIAKTIPVSAIMPEAAAERNAWAEVTEIPRAWPEISTLGNTRLQTMLPAA